MGGSFSFGPSSVAAFILFIGILIFVHELGHFLAAKYFGIKVLKFSLGFGPPLVRFERGETTYQIALLPLGGFVKMLGDVPGDEVAAEDRHRAFNTVPVYQRAVVAFAGPLFNLVFPVACFFAYYVLGPTVKAPVVGQIEVGGPADVAGLREGDRVLSVDGERVWSFERMAGLIRARPGRLVELELEREGEQKVVQIAPKAVKGADDFGGKETQGRIGVGPVQLGTRVGVDSPLGRAFGFQTGDRLLKVGGQRVKRLTEAEKVFEARRGQVVEVVLARPEPKAAGGLLWATRERPQTLSVRVPEDFAALESLGLASSETFVRALDPKGAAARAGLRPGDRIVALAGRPVSLFVAFTLDLRQLEAEAALVEVVRDGQRLSLQIQNDQKELHSELTGKMQTYYDSGLGLGTAPRHLSTAYWNPGGEDLLETAKLSLFEALVVSVETTARVIGSITLALFKLFSGDISVKQVGGPIMLFQVAAQAAEHGLFTYLQILAVISVNLGIINLLPIPVFDGGHLVFCAIEAIKRKPVDMRVREAFTIVGLVLLAVLVVLVFTNDISRLSDAFK